MVKLPELSLEKEESEARFHGIAFAISLGLVLFVPSSFFLLRMIKGFALLTLLVAGWGFVFHGSTVVSMSLMGTSRCLFQIAVSVVVPLALSSYFIKDAPSITLRGVVEPMLGLWVLIPLGIIGYFSWMAADLLNEEHPFRGFLIACSIIFVICFAGYSGIHFSEDYEPLAGEEEATKSAREAGKFFGQFLVYIIISYGAMLIKLLKRKTPRAHLQRMFRSITTFPPL